LGEGKQIYTKPHAFFSLQYPKMSIPQSSGGYLEIGCSSVSGFEPGMVSRLHSLCTDGSNSASNSAFYMSFWKLFNQLHRQDYKFYKQWVPGKPALEVSCTHGWLTTLIHIVINEDLIYSKLFLEVVYRAFLLNPALNYIFQLNYS
jgi:hypothetical protein